jgi:hypothetical protein
MGCVQMPGELWVIPTPWVRVVPDAECYVKCYQVTPPGGPVGADIWFGARVMFCEGTVQPKLELIGQCLTRDLARRFGPDLAVSFPECSPRNQDQRRKDDELDAMLGLRTYNEVRRARGLPPYADPRFDRPILPGDAKPPRPRLELPS